MSHRDVSIAFSNADAHTDNESCQVSSEFSWSLSRPGAIYFLDFLVDIFPGFSGSEAFKEPLSERVQSISVYRHFLLELVLDHLLAIRVCHSLRTRNILARVCLNGCDWKFGTFVGDLSVTSSQVTYLLLTKYNEADKPSIQVQSSQSNDDSNITWEIIILKRIRLLYFISTSKTRKH